LHPLTPAFAAFAGLMIELGPDGQFVALHAIDNGLSFPPTSDQK
jgi:hypothetical protein